MKLLDLYVLRKFVTILSFTLLAWIIIFIVVDLIENLDKFLSNNAALGQVVVYYLYYIPYIIILTFPVSMLLSSLFCLGSMAQYNEIIAIQTAGVSLYRIISPLLILAFFISVATGVAGETVVPQANRLRLDLWRYKIKKETRKLITNRQRLAIQDGENRQVFIQFYDGSVKRGHKVNILWVEDSRLVKREDAKIMQWDETKGGWLLIRVTERTFSDSGETVTQLDTVFYRESKIHPEDLEDLEFKPEEMNYAELNRFVNKMLSIGADARKWLVDLYMKISYPFANFIIVLFGAPLASRKRRSGPALGFALALLISFVYFLFLRTGQVLGHKGDLEPWIAAWIGNIVFGVGGIIIMLRVRK